MAITSALALCEPDHTAPRGRDYTLHLLVTGLDWREGSVMNVATLAPGYAGSVAPGCKFRDYRRWSRRGGSMNRDRGGSPQGGAPMKGMPTMPAARAPGRAGPAPAPPRP